MQVRVTSWKSERVKNWIMEEKLEGHDSETDIIRTKK